MPLPKWAGEGGARFTPSDTGAGSFRHIEGLGGHEIKSAKTGFGWEEDEIPDVYYAQVQHYMKVTGLPWFVVSVYILDDESLHHYKRVTE